MGLGVCKVTDGVAIKSIMRIRLDISYCGTHYHGWQKQADRRTIQGELETALEKIFGIKCDTIGSGRTDEGVHAYNQVVHFDICELKMPCDNVVNALNFHLPKAIRVNECKVVPNDFHSLASAKKKTYIYDMYLSDIDCPFLINRALRLNKNIDIKKMQAAAKEFVGTHDFTPFSAKGSDTKTTVRTVTECEITKIDLNGQKGLRLTISSSGFLYKMVRIIVGAIVKAGQDKLSTLEIKNLLNSGKEWDKKVPADPCGLYLYRVYYCQLSVWNKMVFD